jgi:putative oxidoreductase
MPPTADSFDLTALSTGLLIGRLILGLSMTAHGSQKLFGWFGGHGLAGTAGFLESIGYRPGRLFATAAALGEVGSGLLVALGLFNPLGEAIMISVMLVAMMMAHWQHGFFATDNGIELPLLYMAGAVALAFTGPGAYSLDAALGLNGLHRGEIAATAMGVAVVGAVVVLALRRTSPPAAAGRAA